MKSFARRHNVISTLALLAVVVGTSLTACTGWELPQNVAEAALILYLGLEGFRTKGGAFRMFMAASLSVPVALLFLPDPLRGLGHALTEASSLAGLFTALGFLREAAEESELVRECGDTLVRQPPGRRYLMLA